MKKIIYLGLVATMGVAMTGCDDFLDENRPQQTVIENTPEYWNNPDNVQLQCDRYIDELNNGYGSTSGATDGQFLFSTRSDDQVGANFVDWSYTSVPSTNGSWSYSKVRGANFIINNVRTATGLTATQAKNFEGIARLIRADAYYKLVRNFGDVVWEEEVIDPSNTEALYAAPTSRDIVIDKVMEDIDYAISNISADKAMVSWSKDLARCYKVEVALYEGTFCKYRNKADNNLEPDPARANKYLTMAATTAKELMGKYGFAVGIDGYHSIYNSVWGGGETTIEKFKGQKITDFTKNPEIIFGRRYDATNFRHSTISYSASSTTTSGMSLDAFKAFLFVDGKPAATTSENTSLVGEPTTFEGQPAYSIAKLLQVRDKRLSVCTDAYVYYKGMEWSREGCSGMNASAGLGVAKYDNVLLPVNARTNSASNYTSCPIYWNSYIMLCYMEAVAELGTITDADLNLTFNKFMTRAGLPTRTIAELQAMNDPANNMGVSSLLWEIRRCRRCELMFDGFRFWDLIRWHQLQLLDSKQNPDILRGAYVANAPVKPATVDADGFFRPYPDFNREYKFRYYLLPIPSSQLNLYLNYGNNLKQNHGW